MNLSRNDQKSAFASKLSNASQSASVGNYQTFQDQVDVVLVFLPKYDKEYIPSVTVNTKANGDIELYPLMEHLKTKGYPIEKNVISYYNYPNDMYVYIGSDPIPKTAFVPLSEISVTGDVKQVTIRIRQVHSTGPIPSDILVPDKDIIKIEHFGQGMEKDNSDDGNAPKQKRTKERKIGEILDKVLQWRKLYTGVPDPATGQITKLSLEEAAQRVGISKKSLDDYLLQIRFGKKHGFNFNDHYHDRVGVLRSFVKKHKNKKIEKGGDDDNFDFPNEFENLIQKKDKNGNEIVNQGPVLSKKSKKI